MYYPLTFKGS